MEKENNQNPLMTFGEHLEVFRKMLFRILAVAMIIAIVTSVRDNELYLKAL